MNFEEVVFYVVPIENKLPFIWYILDRQSFEKIIKSNPSIFELLSLKEEDFKQFGYKIGDKSLVEKIHEELRKINK